MAKILLLQADRQLAKTAQDFFDQAGHQLNYFTDPQAAVLAADSNRPDVIILDLFLASRSGVEFLYELRSYPEWQSIPIIVTGNLSSGQMHDYVIPLQDLEVLRYLSRQSISLPQLLAEAESALQPAAV